MSYVTNFDAVYVLRRMIPKTLSISESVFIDRPKGPFFWKNYWWFVISKIFHVRLTSFPSLTGGLSTFTDAKNNEKCDVKTLLNFPQMTAASFLLLSKGGVAPCKQSRRQDMFSLFELAKIITFQQSEQSRGKPTNLILHHAWKEVGERSILALLFSNGRFKLDWPNFSSIHALYF